MLSFSLLSLTPKVMVTFLLSARLWLVVPLLAVGLTDKVSAEDWNQWLGANRNSAWNENGILTKFPEAGLNRLWSTPISAGFSGPAVAGDRVFVSDFVLAEGDPTFDAGKRSQLTGKERLHCLDRKTGGTIWVREYDVEYNHSYALGPRATPTIDNDFVYHLGAEGQLNCYRVENGETVWERDLKAEYKLKEAPMWGFAAHPLVDGDLLFCVVGGPESVAVAFEKNTGKEVWRSLSAKSQGYCPPTMIQAAGQQQLVVFHPESVNGLDPKTGNPLWSVELRPAYDMAIVAPIQTGEHLLVTALQGSTLLLKLNQEKAGVTEVWRGKGTQPDHNPPVVHEDHIYGVDVNGHLRCIELKSGERVWESLATCPDGRPANSATGFLVRNGNQWFIMTEQGELILAKLSPAGYEEVDRAKIVEPTSENWGRKIVWSHPAFSQKCVFVRNDKEIVCYSLAE